MAGSRYSFSRSLVSFLSEAEAVEEIEVRTSCEWCSPSVHAYQV